MMSPIHWALKRGRVTLLTLAFLLVAGTVAYVQIPKEANPDISIPVAYLSMSLDGVSPADAERTLVKPMEQEMRSLEGLDRIEGNAYKGGGSIVAHFETGVDIDQSIEEMRFKVDDVMGELPDDVKRPKVQEVNLSLEPVLLISLSGPVTERALLAISKRLQDELESLEEVLEVNLRGSRDEVVEIILDPLLIQSYNLPLESVIATVRKHNVIIPAGELDTGSGRFAIELPSLFEEASQIAKLPLIVQGERIVRLQDVATIRRTFKDYDSYARVNGNPSLTLEVVKRTGKNVVITTEKARAIIAAFRQQIPEQIRLDIRQDTSQEINDMLNDLQNNIFSAVILMLIVLIASLGVRGGLLVSAAIPSSFVCGILFLYVTGFTVNIVVLFALILSVGILTDAAVVVTEYADRRIAQGIPKQLAFGEAASRMSLPIISSTLTSVLAFVPLMFWPDVVGEFMKYMPITMIAVLSASLIVALIFLPVMGTNFAGIVRTIAMFLAGFIVFFVAQKALTPLVPAPWITVLVGAVTLLVALGVYVLMGRFNRAQERREEQYIAQIQQQFATEQVTAFGRGYRRVLSAAIAMPWAVLSLAVFVLMGSYALYFTYGKGVEFFPNVEPKQINVRVYARGNLAVSEQDAFVREVEQAIIDLSELHDDFDSIYASSGDVGGRNDPEDIIGVIRLDLKDEGLHRPSSVIRRDIVEATKNIPGIVVQVRLPRAGPPINKAVQVELVSNDPAALEQTFYTLRDQIYTIDGLIDFEDSTPKPGIDWIYNLDARKLEQYQVSTSTVGSVLQLATKGYKVSSIRPDNSEEEIDIIARLPLENRTLEQINSLRINTNVGLIPLNNFITRTTRPSSDTITRENAARKMTIAADVRPGVLVDNMVREVQAVIASNTIPDTVRIKFKGEEEKQNESQQFLLKAFSIALFMILVVLLVQFNSFLQALLVLSAIIMSTIGVMLGHLIIQKPFSIVMSGIGVIALAGIVVNNNIILIDTFNQIKKTAPTLRRALLETGAQRLRPVLLTSFTTSLGLLPAVLQTKVDFIARNFSFGGAAGQWWFQLSSSIFFGLIFATLLTLLVTPTLLFLSEKRFWIGRLHSEQDFDFTTQPHASDNTQAAQATNSSGASATSTPQSA